MFEINVKGTWLMCQAFGPCMAREGRGSIVNIGSIYGQVSPDQRLYEELQAKPWTKPLAYTATKGALPAMGRWLATYWAQKGVRVNTLVCGGVAGNQGEEFQRRYSERVPMGRMATAEDYVGALVYLLSDASRYQTGSVVTVDGGWTAW
jgi:NAD(P)-dependent dehydrogenase (short-subunit alcohol dehydrogenase family)